MMPEKKRLVLIGWKVVCVAYNALYDRGLVSFLLTRESRNKVEALANSINGSFFGTKNYESAELKAVAFLYFIIKDHAFTDGNKRTATLVFEVACELNGMQPTYGDFTLDELAVFIERHKSTDHRKFIGRMAKMLFNGR